MYDTRGPVVVGPDHAPAPERSVPAAKELIELTLDGEIESRWSARPVLFE